MKFKGIIAAIYFLIGFTCIFFTGSGEKNWKLRKNENGIKVYTRDIENSNQKELKAYTTINSSLSTLVDVILDIPACTTWVYSCSKSLILKKINEQELIYYSLLDIPWPAEDRDMVLHLKVSQDKKTKIVTFKTMSRNDILKENPGIVRMKNVTLAWRLKPLSSGSIEAQYYLKSDPGGIVPDWMLEFFMVTGPYESMLNIKEMIKNSKYSNVHFDFIEEF
ncbi:MAG: hypothetical protein HY738_05895 [Bacteroidia bacterium]|nr:hypothetical protein [Bacteroidia bacterium]